MADTKISALTSATTPLAGTEVLPIVQNSATVKVAVNNLFENASSTKTGVLSSTDWSTFNGKQAALVSGTNIKTVSGTSLLGSGDVGTIGTGYGGTGLTSFTNKGVVYASSTSALATGSALTFDGSNLKATGSITSAVANSATKQLSLSATNLTNADCNIWLSTGYTLIAPSTATPLAFGTATKEQMRLFASGGVSIGNTTDPGAANLSVSGNVVITTSGKGLYFAGNGNVLWRCGAGTPEGAVTAPIGSLYTRTDGGANTTLYVKESGTGNTGWVAK